MFLNKSMNICPHVSISRVILVLLPTTHDTPASVQPQSATWLLGPGSLPGTFLTTLSFSYFLDLLSTS